MSVRSKVYPVKPLRELVPIRAIRGKKTLQSLPLPELFRLEKSGGGPV